MGAFSLVLALCAPLIIMNFLPHHKVKAIDIISAISGSSSSTGRAASDSKTDEVRRTQSDVIARNTLLTTFFGDGVQVQDLMVIICEGLQPFVSACADVPSFSDFMERNGVDDPTSTTRGKRFAGSFSSNAWMSPTYNSNSFGNFSPFHSSSNFSSHFNFGSHFNNSGSHFNNFGSHFNNFGSGYFSSGFNTAVICPTQADQSVVYQLNPDSTMYPAGDIGNELTNNQALLMCLMREILLSTDPPSIAVEDFRLTTNVTCPFTQLRLWQYQSLAAGSMCWILQNFQENVLYRNCSERFCRNCKNKQTSFGHLSNDDNLNQKFCITDFRTVSTWSYCPNLPQGQRIIRDRIIIPSSCSCQSIRCEEIPQWKK